ncbi:MAG TPA: sugar ABC transporter permease [Actinomycetota bacterium]|nr:sugar ABC transporter permease [Actinomycetota bacterium]
MAQVAVPAGRPVGKRRRGPRGILREMRREWTAYLFNAPGLILFAIFTVYAVTEAFILSFHRWNILQPTKPFVGLQNYRQVLRDGTFWASIGHSVYFTIGSLFPTLAIGLFLAILLNSKLRAVGLFRTAFYLPAITPLVISSLIWKWVYNGDYGLANYYLQKAHLISKPVDWLSNFHLAMPAVIVMQIWIGIGFSMVVYLAGLQAIPRELYEAAEVDGAGRWRQFRKITLPLLAPTTIFLLVIQVILLMNAFDQIFVMTGGGPPGPGGVTTTVTYYIYTNAFRYYRMGYASALSWVLFVILFTVSFIQFRYYVKRVERA